MSILHYFVKEFTSYLKSSALPLFKCLFRSGQFRVGCVSLAYGLIFGFVHVEVLPPCQLNGVMSSAVSLPNPTFSWAGLVPLAVNDNCPT